MDKETSEMIEKIEGKGMGRLLCLFGLHQWHPTARIFDGGRVSKEMCVRRCCGKRRWYA